jgi:hypothetical protein
MKKSIQGRIKVQTVNEKISKYFTNVSAIPSSSIAFAELFSIRLYNF